MWKKSQKMVVLALFFFMLLLGIGQNAHALLSAVGPVDPATGNGFPAWYQDGSGVILGQCNFSAASPDPNCIPAGPAVAPIPGIDFSEAFWWAATAIAPDQGNVSGTLLVLGLEAAFATGEPVAGQQIVFARIRIRADVFVAGTYTVTHPFGTNVYNVTNPGIRAINDTIDFGVAAGDFATVLGSSIGPFLSCVTPAPPAGYLGNFGVPCTVSGSPFNTNIFQITGPGTNTGTTQFNVSGKVFTGSPLNIQRSSYARTAAGAAQVNVFATSVPTAVLTVSDPGGIVPTTAMTGDGSGRFFASIPIASAPLLPASISVTADNSATNPNSQPTTLTSTLFDVVTISQASYDPTAPGTLSIQASSSDAFVPPVLTAVGFGNLVANPLIPGAGSLNISPLIPPSAITVNSTKGGTDSEPVLVGVAPPAGNLPPVAVNDTASTALDTPVAIGVLANDTDANGLNAASIAIVSSPAGGTALVGPTLGFVTYTPALGFSGVDAFAYTVQDSLGAVSNVATVTVTVSAAVNPPPVAGDDSATTAQNTAVVINVLANDTDANGLNPASVTVVNAPAGGVTAVDAVSGAITYTPNPGFAGLDSFTYTVQDTLGAVSNVAVVRVGVGVSANPPPVALNDSISTLRNTAVSISVLANDSDANGLNSASLAVVAAPVNGTAIVNPAAPGTILYTPAVGFVGTDSFSYTVQDTLGAVSNVAIVTVTVTAPVVNLPPVAVNDTIGTPQGSPVLINVLANDSDPDGVLDITTLSAATQPLNGVIFVNNAVGVITYTPNAGFQGTDSFTYRIADNLGAISNTATVTVNVQAANIESIAVLRAEFRAGANEWRIEGTGTLSGATLTIHLGSNLTGPVIGTALVSAGAWQFRGTSGTVPTPGTANTISVESTGGGTVLGSTLTVR